MSSLTASLPAGNPPQWVVTNRLLFLIYLPMLLVYPIVLADQLWWHGVVREALPIYPEKLLWWLFIFNLPHIVAGHLAYADREYLTYYKKPLTKAVLITLAVMAIVPLVFGGMSLFVVGFVYTMYHVLMQQYGISLMLLGKRPDWAFQGWKWLSIAGAAVLYLLLYAGPFIQPQEFEGARFLARALLAFSVPFGVILLVRAFNNRHHKREGFYYFLLNFVMIYSAWVLFELGYPFFVNAVPRIAHDFTAFAVYTTHDHNRHQDGQPNVLYRWLARFHIDPALGCVLVALLVAGIMTMGMYLWFPLIYPIIFISFIHYYMEGHIWKRGSLHRRYAPFAGA